jgi:poly-gamma-glutamate capsule biosynthesis protein CapA/YwtB (metallophosphatase superfamily)
VTSYRQLLTYLILVALSACTTTPPPDTATEPEPVPTPAAEIPGTIETKTGPKRTIKTAPPETLISIAAVGDMMIGTDFPRNHLPDDDGVSFFSAVTPFLSAADIAVGNLEGTLIDGGEPAKKCKNLNACYLFRSPTRYAQHYRDAGFDALSVANNHARDFGEDGRTATMQALDAVGIHHSGRAGEFATFEVNGLSVAFLAYAVTQKSNLLHDYELAEETVAEFAAAHDIVIVTFHGGAEGASMMHVPFAEEDYYGEPRGDVARFSRSMVDAGADLVLGHGPHVVRGMERYKDRLIAYSLGNFATYYGISVEGVKGIAPILIATLDQEGRFIEGEIISTVQLRPDGPSVDPEQRALNLIRGLSLEDFENPGLTFHRDGRISY